MCFTEPFDIIYKKNLGRFLVMHSVTYNQYVVKNGGLVFLRAKITLYLSQDRFKNTLLH